MKWLSALLLLFAAACGPAPQTSAPAQPTAIDDEIRTAVTNAMPGVTITGGAPDGVDEFEVTGTLNREEYEFDLVGPQGGWRVTEIQRDIAWTDTPQNVRDAAAAAPNAFTPVRVIESRQPADGSIVYELFAEGAQPGNPTMEVRLLDGQAAVTPPAH